MFDGNDLILWILLACPFLGFSVAAYLDWGSKHLDKVPEWIRKELTRNKRKKQ